MHFEPWFWPEFFSAINETIYMVGVGLVISVIIGLPIGVILVITRENGILENKVLFNILNIIINIFRSIPFIILMVAIIPFTTIDCRDIHWDNRCDCTPCLIYSFLYRKINRKFPSRSRSWNDRISTSNGRYSMANNLEIFASGSFRFHSLGANYCYDRFNWSIGNGRSGWCRRSRGLSYYVWL